MRRFAPASLVALALTCVLAAPARADISDIRAADRSVEIDLGAHSLKYGETINNQTFDTENGWGPSVGFGLRYLSSDKTAWSIFHNIYIDVEGQGSFSGADYSGGCQHANGTTTPLQATTNEQIYDLSGKIGRAFALSDSVMLIPFGDLGGRYWVRQITADNCGGNSTETYGMGTLQGGLLLQLSPWQHWVISLFGEGGQTFSAQMKTEDANDGDGDIAKLNLGNQPVYSFGAKVGYTMAQNWEVTAAAKFRGFGFGQSHSWTDGLDSVMYEPSSYTHEIDANIGLAYHLP